MLVLINCIIFIDHYACIPIWLAIQSEWKKDGEGTGLQIPGGYIPPLVLILAKKRSSKKFWRK